MPLFSLSVARSQTVAREDGVNSKHTRKKTTAGNTASAGPFFDASACTVGLRDASSIACGSDRKTASLEDAEVSELDHNGSAFRIQNAFRRYRQVEVVGRGMWRGYGGLEGGDRG